MMTDMNAFVDFKLLTVDMTIHLFSLFFIYVNTVWLVNRVYEVLDIPI